MIGQPLRAQQHAFSRSRGGALLRRLLAGCLPTHLPVENLIHARAATLPGHAAGSRYAMGRLIVALLSMTLGNSGMYAVAVILPAVQAEFGVARADASLPYTALLIGFGIGGGLMGRLADRCGLMWPLLLGAASLGSRYVLCGLAGGIGTFTLVHGVLIGLLGSSASFAPLVAPSLSG